jgi:hypothetical protein
MYPRSDSSSRALRTPGIFSSKGSSRVGSRATSAQLSTTTVKYHPLSTGPNWHLPKDWDWSGDTKTPKDVIYEDESQFPGREWSASKGTAVLGQSMAIVTRVVCNGKVLARKSVTVTKWNKEYYLDEVEVLKRLNHQHIVQICGTYTVKENFHTLVYPVAEMTLTDYMHNASKLQSANWTRVMINGMGCLSNALTYIHAVGVKHKDIKPDNILILGDILIISDFGSAM